jgi:hypothetical protein
MDGRIALLGQPRSSAVTARALRLATAGPIPDLYPQPRNRSRLQTWSRRVDAVTLGGEGWRRIG